MPKESARIWLEVTNVRVERVQEISEEDAKAEGIRSYWAEPHRNDPPFIGAAKELGKDLCSTRTKAFSQIWDGLNAKRGYGWDTNPLGCGLWNLRGWRRWTSPYQTGSDTA